MMLRVLYLKSFVSPQFARISAIQSRFSLKLQTSAETNGDKYIRLETSRYQWVSYRRRVHTNAYRSGDEYIRQETSTYQCPEVRRRVHTIEDKYIRVLRGQETSRYDRRRVHMSRYKSKELSSFYFVPVPDPTLLDEKAAVRMCDVSGKCNCKKSVKWQDVFSERKFFKRLV